MSADKRAALLRTGEELFARHGYREINIEEITRATGMGTGSFYHYFPSKEAFFEEILDGAERRAVEEAERMIARLQSPLNQLKVLYRYLSLGIPRSPLLRGVLAGDRRFAFPGLRSRLEGHSPLRLYITRALAEILERGTRKRVFRARLFHDAQAMLMAIFDAVLLKLDDPRADDLLDDVLLLLARGLPRRIRLRQRDERLDRRVIG